MSGSELSMLDFALEDAEAFALEAMQRRGGVNGMFIGWPPTRERIVVGVCDWQEKDLLAALVRSMFKLKGVDVYAAMTEAWLVVSRDGRALDTSVAPSRHPDKIEALVVTAFARDGAFRVKVWKIVREPWGKFKKLEEMELPPGMDGVAGRFAELLR